MIVAVIAVRVVEVAADSVIDVAAVRNCFVTAARAMNMPRRMTAAVMVRGTAVGVVPGYFDHVLVDVTFVRMVQVAIVQIVDVAAMPHGGMPATRTVLMGMVGMVWCGASGHGISSFPCPGAADTTVRPSAAWSMALWTNGSTCSSASA